jgi:type IX secretion system substrate protein
LLIKILHTIWSVLKKVLYIRIVNKTFLFVSCVILLEIDSSFSQNLVPNPSFEDTIQCPDNLDQVSRAVGWFAGDGTPDYYNSCFVYPGFGSNVSVPLNSFGYQSAFSGNAYMGMGTFYSDTSAGGIRETVGIHLIDTLKIEYKYYVSFYVSLHRISSGTCAANKMGAWFSSGLYQWSNMTPVPRMNQSQVYSDSIVVDTLDWVKIKGTFIADSNYSYIYIGNFFHDSLVSFIQQFGPHIPSYYYVDNICVSSDSNYCDTWVGIQKASLLKNDLIISPNPFSNSFTIQSENINEMKIELYDILGKIHKIITEKKRNAIKVHTQNLTYGTFFLKIILPSNVLDLKIIHIKN